MSRVRSFFLREAGECLAAMGTEVERESMELSTVYGAVRRLRGSAQMARFDGVARRAGVLERRLRSYMGGGSPGRGGSDADSGRTGSSEEEIRREVREVVRSLRADVAAVREGRLEEDPRMETGMDAHEEQDGQDGVEVVPIETLEYRGDAALERALELRSAIEDVVVSDGSAGPVLDELFDLIRLGAK